MSSALATRGIQLGTSTEPVILSAKMFQHLEIYMNFENTKSQGVLNQPHHIDDEGQCLNKYSAQPKQSYCN